MVEHQRGTCQWRKLDEDKGEYMCLNLDGNSSGEYVEEEDYCEEWVYMLN